MTQGVLVDGISNTREMWLPERLRVVSVPIYRPTSLVIDDAPSLSQALRVDFLDIGDLPDDRVVYVQRGFDMSLWRFNATYLPADTPKYGLDLATGERVVLHEDAARYEVERNFERFAQSAKQPFRVLYDHDESQAGAVTVVRWGVGVEVKDYTP